MPLLNTLGPKASIYELWVGGGYKHSAQSKATACNFDYDIRYTRIMLLKLRSSVDAQNGYYKEGFFGNFREILV